MWKEWINGGVCNPLKAAKREALIYGGTLYD